MRIRLGIEAFNGKELITLRKITSRNKAINMMKEYKEFLDLEIISQEEYDSILVYLKPIILKKITTNSYTHSSFEFFLDSCRL